MKLSDLGVNIEAAEFFRGCQEIPSYPDAPQAVSEFNAGKNCVSVIPAHLAAIEGTMLNGTTQGAELYKKLSELDFFYILVVCNGNIDAAFVPDEVFTSAAEAEAYALLHRIEYAALR